MKQFIDRYKKYFLVLSFLLFFLTLVPRIESQSQIISNQTVQDINNYKNTSEASSLARLITVKFFSRDGNSIQGSGFLLARSPVIRPLDNNDIVFTYLVLTNAHVARDNKKDIYIQMHNEAIHRVELHPSNEKLFVNNEDVKVLYFNSRVDYAVPTISNTEKLKSNKQVIVSGYPCIEGSVCNISVRAIKIHQGNAEVIKKIVRGYNLAYDVSSESGSSGGPIIWNNSVIGINGIGPGTTLTTSQYEYFDGSKRSSGSELDRLKKSSLGISLDSLKLDSDNKQLFDNLPKTEKDIQYYPMYIKQLDISSSAEAKVDQLQKEIYIPEIPILIYLFLFIIVIINTINAVLISKLSENYTRLDETMKEEFSNILGLINRNPNFTRCTSETQPEKCRNDTLIKDNGTTK